jgi:hypothetical protein
MFEHITMRYFPNIQYRKKYPAKMITHQASQTVLPLQVPAKVGQKVQGWKLAVPQTEQTCQPQLPSQ